MLEVLNSLHEHAIRRADDEAVTDGAVSVTYRDLSDRMGGLAMRLGELPDVVGILAPDCVEWIIADLALAHTGKVAVPLPHFFSPGQLSHIIADAGIMHVLTTVETSDMADGLNIPHSLIGDDRASPGPCLAARSRRIIYTSGTTGKPKGVRLGHRQIDAAARALTSAVAATEDDRYLSVLPFSLLLEQIAAIAVPILSGARVCIARGAFGAIMNGDPSVLIKAAERFKPTVSVMVPELLAAWIGGIKSGGTKPPDCLRFVAVGGAPVAADMADQGWQLGIPVHEGYGLSECCSVVAVNRLSRRVSGTVGKAIEGIGISIEDGEIIVSGATVMDGYLHGNDIDGIWHTGDMGKWDENGNLVVLGRKDNVIVTPNGRNINPEWIEGMILVSPMIERCTLAMNGEGSLSVAIVPSMAGEEWFRRAGDGEITDLLLRLCREAPEYARPAGHSVIWSDEIDENGQITAAGMPDHPGATKPGGSHAT